MKKKRLEKIVELISTHNVATQEELQALLEEQNFKTTQATISRDIKELRLIKTISSSGLYYYTLPLPPTTPQSFKINVNSVFLESVISVDRAGNFIVVKTNSGMAGAVCEAIDNCGFPDLMGTIAGDNTIFILLRTEPRAADFAGYLTGLLKKK